MAIGADAPGVSVDGASEALVGRGGLGPCVRDRYPEGRDAPQGWLGEARVAGRVEPGGPRGVRNALAVRCYDREVMRLEAAMTSTSHRTSTVIVYKDTALLRDVVDVVIDGGHKVNMLENVRELLVMPGKDGRRSAATGARHEGLTGRVLPGCVRAEMLAAGCLLIGPVGQVAVSRLPGTMVVRTRWASERLNKLVWLSIFVSTTRGAAVEGTRWVVRVELEVSAPGSDDDTDGGAGAPLVVLTS